MLITGFARRVTLVLTAGLACLQIACATPLTEPEGLRAETEEVMAAARSAVDEAVESKDLLPPGADGAVEMQALVSDLENLGSRLAASERLLEGHHFEHASRIATEVRLEAEAIVADVERAAAAWPRVHETAQHESGASALIGAP